MESAYAVYFSENETKHTENAGVQRENVLKIKYQRFVCGPPKYSTVFGFMYGPSTG